MYNFVSTSEEDTKKLARDFASKLKTGDILVLSGDLGSRQNALCARNVIFLEFRRRSL